MTDNGERLEAVLESITDGFVTLDADWRFTYANRRAEQMLGRSRHELLGRNGLEVFPEGIGSRIHQELDRARQQHSVIEFESLTTPGNRWFEVRAYPAEENGLTVYFRDITRKKRAQESIALQARMLDAVGQAVIAVANDGTVFYWNKAAEKLLGWTADQVIGRAAIAVMHPEHEKGGVAEALNRLEHAETWAGEVTLRRRDGTRFPAHVSDSPIQDEQGEVVGMVRVATDSSARHADEQAQRLLAKAGSALAATLDYEHTLAALVQFAVPELADCCIVDVIERDGSGRRVEVAWSSSGQGAPRFSAQTLNEKPTATGLLRKGEAVLISNVNDKTLNQLACNPTELRRLRDAKVRSVIVAPLNIGAHEIGTFSIITSNRSYNRHDLALMTELARRAAFAIDNAMLYETASMANQSKSDFLAVMSHELRTPLTTVMGYTDLLLAGVPNPLTSQSQVYVGRIRSAAWHLLGLIEQILIYARLEVGREQVHVEKAPLARVLREAAELIEPVALEKGLTFGLTEPPANATIETDVTKLRQILLNLLSNAVKFTDQGEIHLEAQVTPQDVLFFVRDSGVGILPEHLHRVFEPFWQVDQSATRKEGGTGIGLSLSRKLAGLLGGDISVQSTPEEGTVFTVKLPRSGLTPKGKTQ